MKRTPFKAKGGGLKPGKAKARPNPALEAREAIKRQAINALKRARREAEKAGVELSEWEGEFLGSVADRIKTYGRAFADPDKGAAGAPMSALQGRKLREIVAKARGEPRFPAKGARKPGRSRPKMNQDRSGDI